MPSPRLTGAGLLFILIAGLSCLFGVFPQVVRPGDGIYQASGQQASAHVQDHAGLGVVRGEEPGEQGLLQNLGLLATLLSLSFCTALSLLLGRVIRCACPARAPVRACPPTLRASPACGPSLPSLQVFRL